MWLTCVLTASVLWGISYAASERLLARGFSPLGIFFLQALLGCFAAGCTLAAMGKLKFAATAMHSEGSDWLWLLVGSVSAVCAALLILMAVQAKNAPVTALVEISYPLPTAFFCWLFFRQNNMNWQVALGALLIYSGVVVVMMGGRLD